MKVISQLMFFLALGVIVLLNLTFSEYLFSLSLDLTKWNQARRTVLLDLIFEGASFMGNGFLYIILFVLIYNWASRGRALYYLFLLSLLITLMALGKNFFAQPRPYMVDSQIVAMGCTLGFGNPSGHSLFASGFLLVMFLDYFWPFDSDNPEPAQRNSFAFYSTLLMVVLTFTTIGYSRIYVGDHSLDQVLFGFSLGIWSAFYCHYELREDLIDHINKDLDRADSIINGFKYHSIALLLSAFVIGI